MNPKQAIQKLLDLGWSIQQIAMKSGMHRANVYRLLDTKQLPSYEKAIALLEIAKGRPRPPRDEE